MFLLAKDTIKLPILALTLWRRQHLHRFRGEIPLQPVAGGFAEGHDRPADDHHARRA